MFCNKCGHENSQDSAFCSACGVRIPAASSQNLPDSAPDEVNFAVASPRGQTKSEVGSKATSSKTEQITVVVKGIITLLVFSFLIYHFIFKRIGGPAAPGDQAAQIDVVQEAWSAYKNSPGNGDSSSIKSKFLSGKVIKSGTVDPMKFTTTASAAKRWPAYLVQVTYNLDTDGADSNQELYIYYIKKPDSDTTFVNWKGKDYLGLITSDMSSDDFKSN